MSLSTSLPGTWLLQSRIDVTAGAKNNTQAQGGYDAYFGTYRVDDAKGVVTQELMGSLSPANVGMVLSRAMEVTGDTLRSSQPKYITSGHSGWRAMEAPVLVAR